MTTRGNLESLDASCGTAGRSGAVTGPRHSGARGCGGTRVTGTPLQRPEQGGPSLASRGPAPKPWFSLATAQGGWSWGGRDGAGEDGAPGMARLGTWGRGSCSLDKPSRAVCCPHRARVCWRGDPAVGTAPWGSPGVEAQRCQPGHLTQAPSWHPGVETQSPEEEKERQEAAVLPPPWAVICEGTGRKEAYLVGQPLNQCILINKRSNSSK